MHFPNTTFWGVTPEKIMDQKQMNPSSSSHFTNSAQILCIRNLLTTDNNCKLWELKTSYDFNDQYYGDAILFIIVKMVFPDTFTDFFDIKTKMETTKMSYFNQDLTRTKNTM